jgi:8-oxo-dGTP pyrophosphatase MutT (NUDIX family)
MPNGRLVEPYYVLEYPTWVNVVAVTEYKNIVFVRQYRHGVQQTVLELPCGAVDPHDSSPCEAIRRELLEETGYTSDQFIETGRLSPNSANHTNFTYCFLAIDVKRVTQPALDDTEQIETELIPLNDVMGLIDQGEVYQALHVASLFFALRKLEIIQV